MLTPRSNHGEFASACAWCLNGFLKRCAVRVDGATAGLEPATSLPILGVSRPQYVESKVLYPLSYAASCSSLGSRPVNKKPTAQKRAGGQMLPGHYYCADSPAQGGSLGPDRRGANRRDGQHCNSGVRPSALHPGPSRDSEPVSAVLRVAVPTMALPAPSPGRRRASAPALSWRARRRLNLPDARHPGKHSSCGQTKAAALWPNNRTTPTARPRARFSAVRLGGPIRASNRASGLPMKTSAISAERKNLDGWC
jgi:hypothetical protein